MRSPRFGLVPTCLSVYQRGVKNAVLADNVTEGVLAAADYTETLALPEFIISVSFQKEPITNLATDSFRGRHHLKDQL
jgi:hypothetical protein